MSLRQITILEDCPACGHGVLTLITEAEQGHGGLYEWHCNDLDDIECNGCPVRLFVAIYCDGNAEIEVAVL